jgi:hypothetical protein
MFTYFTYGPHNVQVFAVWFLAVRTTGSEIVKHNLMLPETGIISGLTRRRV